MKKDSMNVYGDEGLYESPPPSFRIGHTPVPISTLGNHTNSLCFIYATLISTYALSIHLHSTESNTNLLTHLIDTIVSHKVTLIFAIVIHYTIVESNTSHCTVCVGLMVLPSNVLTTL